jgi:hypothetical protein
MNKFLLSNLVAATDNGSIILCHFCCAAEVYLNDHCILSMQFDVAGIREWCKLLQVATITAGDWIRLLQQH